MPETRQVGDAPADLCPERNGAPVAGAATPPGPAPRGRGHGPAVADFVRWGRAGVAALERARPEIDALNVFPVPDSDTGRNLLTTMRAAVAAADAAGGGHHTEDSVRRYAAAMARGAVSGARGNSGIILSQILRGLAEATGDGPFTGANYRDGLALAAVLVRDSLSEPVEGTVLTVLDRASEAARACSGAGLAEVADAAAEAAAAALERTRDQLPVLRTAGVVDAGARGLLVLLDTMVAVATGESPIRPVYAPAQVNPAACSVRSAPDPTGYEVMFRVTATDEDRIAELRARLTRLGDSVVVASDGAGGWSAHVHCEVAGAAIEAGLAAGTVQDIHIEYLVESGAATAGGRNGAVPAGAAARCGPAGRETAATVTAHPGAAVDASSSGAATRAGAAAPVGADAPQCSEPTRLDGTRSSGRSGAAVDRGVLAVVAGAGATALFEAAGAVVLAAERASESAALLGAIRAMPHREVMVLPNGALPAHELVAVGVAARNEHRDVLLLPSASMVQGLAALAVHDRARIAVDDAFAMSEAAASTRWGALRRADERALTMVGTCAAGDGLGLVGHDVVVIDRDTRAAGHTLLDRMLGLGGELVTLLVGAEAPDGLAADLARHIETVFPGVEVAVYSGGQHGDLIQIGVE